MPEFNPYRRTAYRAAIPRIMAHPAPQSQARLIWLVAIVTGLLLALAPLPVTVGLTANPDPNLERELLALTNVDRTSNGLGSLLPEERLIDVARRRSDDMLTRNYFSHTIPPSGEKVYVMLDQQGVDYQLAGENLAWNNAGTSASVQKAEMDFMNSPTHRANVLKPGYTDIGIGAIPGADRIMFTVLFMRPFEDALVIRAAPLGVVEPTNAENLNPIELTVANVLGRSLDLPGHE
jgi:uncharacterized protein YkwD